MADCAICSGVTGTCGLRPTVSPDPVIAQVMNAFQFIGSVTPGGARYRGPYQVRSVASSALTASAGPSRSTSAWLSRPNA